MLCPFGQDRQFDDGVSVRSANTFVKEPPHKDGIVEFSGWRIGDLATINVGETERPIRAGQEAEHECQHFNIPRIGRHKAREQGKVFIASRKDASPTGIFTVEANVALDPASMGYPAYAVHIRADLRDGAKATFSAT